MRVSAYDPVGMDSALQDGGHGLIERAAKDVDEQVDCVALHVTLRPAPIAVLISRQSRRTSGRICGQLS